MSSVPYLGYGLGLRPQHYEAIVHGGPKVDWFEVLSENYLVPGGKPLYYLEQVRERFPVVMHGVSLSIGSVDPLDWAYLAKLKELALRIEPKWVSDHLCFTGYGGANMHDLLPLPYTEEALTHVVGRIEQVQDHLKRRILLENVSSYISYQYSVMPEWEFLANLAKQADCLILLDINNIYVSAYNHGFDPKDYLAGIPIERVAQFHIAGHSNRGTHIIDTHDAPVADPVWALYAAAARRFGQVSTLLERDDSIPPLSELVTELDHCRTIGENIRRQAA